MARIRLEYDTDTGELVGISPDTCEEVSLDGTTLQGPKGDDADIEPLRLCLISLRDQVASALNSLDETTTYTLPLDCE